MTQNVRHIQFGKDSSCEMGIVLIDGECVMCGKYWDFHPGCHGIDTYGDFRGIDSLVSKIKSKLQCENNTVVVVDRIYYKYGTSVDTSIIVTNTDTKKKTIKKLNQCLTIVEGDNKVAP